MLLQLHNIQSTTSMVDLYTSTNIEMEESNITELADKFINRIYAKSSWSRVSFFLIMIPISLSCAFAMFGFAFTLTPIDFKCDLNNSNVYQNLSADLNSCFITINVTNRSIACPTKFQFIPDKEFMQSSIISDFQLICKDSYFDELLFTIFIWSSTIGDFISPPLIDKLGRQFTFLGSFFVMCLCGIAATFASNYWLLVVCFALIGAGRQFTYNAVYLLVLELIPAERLSLYGLFYQLMGNMFTATVGILAYFFREWKQLQIFCMSIGLLTPLMWFLVPESPRWLITTGKIDRLQNIMHRYVLRFSSMTPDHFCDLTAEIKQYWNSININNRNKSKADRSMYLQVLKTRELLGWIFIIFFSYSYILTASISVNSFLTLEEIHRFVLYTGSSLLDMTYICLVYIMPSRSRNLKLLINQLLGAVSFCIIPFLPASMKHIAVMFMMLGKATIYGSFYLMATTAVYICPSSIRAIVIIWPACLSRIFVAVSPFLISAYNDDKRLPLFCIAGMALSVGLINLLYPELLDNPIPETIEDARELRHNIGFAGCRHHCSKNKNQKLTSFEFAEK